jgi:ParB-like chromosome segregation protein Spo0J
MNIIRLPIVSILPNPKNPRVIKDAMYARLVQSLKEAPWMLEIRPLVVDAGGMVLGGNMRLKAAKEAGFKQVPVIRATDLTPEQQREFIIKDNVGYGEWDLDMLREDWDAEDLEAWGLDIPDLPDEPIDNESAYESKWEVVVECTSESEQERAFNHLKKLGYVCRVLSI